MHRLQQYSTPLWFTITIIGLIALRCFHFDAYIDGPHTWRQCDTANYIWAFYQDGINLLAPSVCWMGGHKTLILEFPLPEAVVAIFYQLFSPDLIWARIVFTLFFLGAVRYLYLVVKQLVNVEVARVATVIYMALPLSIFYSRAIHIDFSAVFFAHAMLYYYLQGIAQASFKKVVWGSIFGVLAFATKAPYAFFFALPLLYWIFTHQRWRFFVKALPLFALPVLTLVWWAWHTQQVNAAAPDWEFIPGYRKFTDNSGWYFGYWGQRFEIPHWITLRDRLVFEVVGIPGLVLMLVGLVWRTTKKATIFAVLWLVGVVAYVLIFFNLNVIHNYYQIPLLAPAALFIAIAIVRLFNWLKNKHAMAGYAAAVVLTGSVVGTNIYYTETTYYRPLMDQVWAGEQIGAHTQPDDLIVVSFGGFDCRSPHLLYRARRNGWSITERDLTPQLIYRLMEEGANYVATLRPSPPAGELEQFLSVFPGKELPYGDQGWKVYLYELSYDHIRAPE